MPVPMAHDPLLLRQTVLDTTDARGLAEFYRELLGLAYRPGHEPPPPGEDDPDGREWLVLRNPGGNQLAFQQVDELTPSTWPEPGIPQQLHLDLTVATREALQREHARALALGARVLRDESQDEVEPIYVYADPAGHPFCIFVAPPPAAAT
jgi:catechol 2,3-dioxygenase-like lactoylglutathione lyase family enzyme